MSYNCCSYLPPLNMDCSCGEEIKKPFQDIETICRNAELFYLDNNFDDLIKLHRTFIDNKREYPLYQAQFINEFIIEKLTVIKQRRERRKAMQKLCSDD